MTWRKTIFVGVLVLLGTGWLGAGIAAAGAVILIPPLWSDRRAVEVVERLVQVQAGGVHGSDAVASTVARTSW